MTSVTFFGEKNELTGFLITGHSTADACDGEGRLVCAAVSSAAYMTANTLTEIIGDCCDITEKDGYLSLKVTTAKAGTQEVLAGFLLHMRQLAEQYGKNIKVNLEV